MSYDSTGCEQIGKIVSVFSWLAEKKSQITVGTVDYIERNVWGDDSLSDSDKLLLHWLVYITDRGKNADVLWPKNVPILKKVIKIYNEEMKCLNFENIDEFIKTWHIKTDKILLNPDKKVASFPNDIEAIMKTFYVLSQLKLYFYSFFEVCIKKIHLQGNKGPILQGVAELLYLLSYANTSAKQAERYKEWDSDVLKIESVQVQWKEFYHKRIWAALRDYVTREKNDKPILPLGGEKNDLLIPGDLWNQNFYKYCLADLIKNDDQKDYKEKIRAEFNQRGKDPVDYDVSFGFARKVCKGRMCKLCIFAEESDIKNICIGDLENANRKICPVGVLMYDTYFKCEGTDCEIKNHIDTKGPCKMPMMRD